MPYFVLYVLLELFLDLPHSVVAFGLRGTGELVGKGVRSQCRFDTFLTDGLHAVHMFLFFEGENISAFFQFLRRIDDPDIQSGEFVESADVLWVFFEKPGVDGVYDTDNEAAPVIFDGTLDPCGVAGHVDDLLVTCHFSVHRRYDEEFGTFDGISLHAVLVGLGHLGGEEITPSVKIRDRFGRVLHHIQLVEFLCELGGYDRTSIYFTGSTFRQ